MEGLEKRFCKKGIDAVVLTSFIDKQGVDLDDVDRLLVQEAREQIVDEIDATKFKNCRMTLLGKKIRIVFHSGDEKNKCLVHLDGEDKPQVHWANEEGDESDNISDQQPDEGDGEKNNDPDEEENREEEVEDELTKVNMISKAQLTFSWQVLSNNFFSYHDGLFDEQRVLIKQFKEHDEQTGRIESEIKILNNLKHENVCKFYGVCKDPWSIVTEYFQFGTLNDFVKVNTVTLKDKMAYARQVASAMSYVISHGYVHLDLQTRSVMVGANNTCKLANFFLTQKLDGEGECSAATNTTFALKWAAPEMFLRQSISAKFDVWSFGIFLVELVIDGEIPYPGITGTETGKLLAARFIMGRPNGCPKQLYHVMTDCWQFEPQDRPSFEDLMKQLDAIQFE